MLENVYWIALIPLIVSIVILLCGQEGPDSKLPYLGVAAMSYSFAHSVRLLSQTLQHTLALPYYATRPWFSFADYEMTLGVLVDGPAVAMLVVVTLVSLLVQVYSLGYMHGDQRFKRFYAYLSFFSASMLGLVLTSNLLVFFACWELVGVSSYLLIGFWFEKEGPAYAMKKAFITTKLGDLGLYLGLLLLFTQTGTLDLNMLGTRAAMGPQYLSPETATAVGLLFLMGAAGKSAQVPLSVWLPDAMEGPTPVSALIHAATMVAAGVYLVARTYPIFAAGTALQAVAMLGLATAFAAATMALVAYDIKRVLAFSTISQLGTMMLGLGSGGYTSGLFHLTTHAFFKALLFLGAGSVIHSVGTNDMRRMGGLSKKMPITFLTMLIATLAIAGMPGLSGWFSKEAILHDVYAKSPAMWGLAVATAALTAFYMFRLLFLTFMGDFRDHHAWEHAHESPPVMTGPLWVLALLSLGAGFVLQRNGLFASLVHLETTHAAAHHAPEWLWWPAFAAFAGGLALAAWTYGNPAGLARAASLREAAKPLVSFLEQHYLLDRFFLAWVRFFDRFAAACFWIDSEIIDRIFVDGWALVTRLLAEIQNFFDNFFVDGAVDGMGTVTQDAGGILSRLVRGQVQEYLLYVALAVSLFATLMLTR